MKDSHQVLVLAFVLFVIGLALFLGALTIQIPSAYNTFLGIPYSVNPEFQSAFSEKLDLLGVGILFFGFALGVLGTIGYIVRLEKKIPQTPPPP
jgi:hypothetical protein